MAVIAAGPVGLGAVALHLGELNPLLVAAGMVVLAAAVLLGAALLAGWVWHRGVVVEPEVPPAPAEPPSPPGERPLARAVQPELALRRESQRLADYAAAAAHRAARARAEAATARERSAAAEAMRDVAWAEYETVSLPLVVPDPAGAPRAGAGDAVADGAGSTHTTDAADAGTATGAGASPAVTDAQGIAHAAFMAFRRGAISVRELQRVWRGAAAPEPGHQEHDREVVRRMARRRAVRQDYESASNAAKLALEQARIAEVAADALAREAADAERDARTAQASVERYLGLPD